MIQINAEEATQLRPIMDKVVTMGSEYFSGEDMVAVLPFFERFIVLYQKDKPSLFNDTLRERVALTLVNNLVNGTSLTNRDLVGRIHNMNTSTARWEADPTYSRNVADRPINSILVKYTNETAIKKAALKVKAVLDSASWKKIPLTGKPAEYYDLCTTRGLDDFLIDLYLFNVEKFDPDIQ